MMDIGKLLQIFKSSTGVTIDSRNVEEGNMFFALKGEKSNGNLFAAAAIEKGASCAVIDDKAYEIKGKTFLVYDVLLALQLLSQLYRSTLHIPVISLTGSNGKTTTKELMHAVLKKKFRCYATKGNLNNHIGVPLSLLSVKTDDEMAVIEMGANHIKEIEFLCSLSHPTHALITNIGLAHLDGFGGPEGVKQAKSELFNYVIDHGGILFVNTQEDKLKDVYEGYANIFTYGISGQEYLSGKIISDDTFAAVSIGGMEIKSNLVGSYNSINILAAACVGKYFDIPIHEIKDAIEHYIPSNNRSEFRKIADNYFILDAYNANPSSMRVALENFIALNAQHKIAILGDMLELGEYAADQHQQIAGFAASGNFEELILVGPEFFNVAVTGIPHQKFKNSDEAFQYFKSKNYSGKNILLKGSRGIQLEKILG